MKGKALPISVIMAFLLIVVAITYYLASVQKDVITVGYMRIVAHLPVIAAKERHKFDEHNLDVKLEPYSDTPSLMKALETGRVDVAFQLTPESVWRSASADRRYYYYFVATSTHESPIDGFYALTDLKAQDLRGATIGAFPGPTASAMLKRILEKAYGLKAGEYTIREVPPPAQIQALRSGDVKALFTYEPIGTALEDSLHAQLLLRDPVSQYIINPWNGGLGVFSEEFAIGRRKVATAFVFSIKAAVDELIRLPTTRGQMMTKLQPGLSAEQGVRVPMMEYHFLFSPIDVQSAEERLEQQIKVYEDLGILESGGRYNVKPFEVK